MFWWMPSRRHSSAIFSSPRSPSKTIRTFSSAEYFLRVLRRISRTVASTAALVSSLMVYSLASLILTRNSHLSFLPSFVSQVLKRYINFLRIQLFSFSAVTGNFNSQHLSGGNRITGKIGPKTLSYRGDRVQLLTRSTL